MSSPAGGFCQSAWNDGLGIISKEMKMYTNGIRKILIVDSHYGHIDKLGEMADKTGHKAILHNGAIYVKVGKHWEATPFAIEDFTYV